MKKVVDGREWTSEGESIMSPQNLEAIRKHLDEVGSIVVEHWHYYGSRAPTPLGFGDYDAFIAYLQTEVQTGDAIDAYPFPERKRALAQGKRPDAEGYVPAGGAY